MDRRSHWLHTSRDWIIIAVLLLLVAGISAIHPRIAMIRSDRCWKQCREQMAVLLEAELKHYLDHQSFTSVQDNLDRYAPYAPYAKCPQCNKKYTIRMTDHDVIIECPCPHSGHGWKHAMAPDAPRLSLPDAP